MSAKIQPAGTAHQIPVTPMLSTAENMYARITLVPKEMTVSTTDIPGCCTARYSPYNRNRHPIPQ